MLWGRHPELEEEFEADWQDWVEWDEADEASRLWHTKRLLSPGSVDLTDPAEPGYVIADCGALETGLIVASHPDLPPFAKQLRPAAEPLLQSLEFFRFSAVRLLPGQCQAAVDAARD